VGTPLTFGSLFAGIGGFDLGFERAGMECKWQVEIDDYATSRLEKHWAQVRRWRDVRTFPPGPDWNVDVICGGFPCQDISDAGLRAGIDGDRSGLWGEFARIIRTIRPRFVVVENVAALLNRGMGRVLGDLAAIGFDAEWDVLPAFAFGADHARARVILVAYPLCERSQVVLRGVGGTLPQTVGGPQWHTDSFDSHCGRLRAMEQRFSEPALLRTNDGLPDWPRGLKPLGNAIYPPVAEWIGRRIVESSEITNA
jgi:DNA (cytosine-5)-methyltransferase 1